MKGPQPSSTLKQSILERDKHKCRYCGEIGKFVHHIKARALGGSNDLSNLITLCNPCHMKSHDLPTYKLTGDGVIETIAKRAGNSAHAMLPKEWIGKNVVVKLK